MPKLLVRDGKLVTRNGNLVVIPDGGTAADCECCVNCDWAETLYLNIGSASNCACAAGTPTITLTYAAVSGKWEGSGSMCGHSVEFALRREDAGGGNYNAFLAYHFLDACVIDAEPGVSWECGTPISLNFLAGSMETCCNTSGFAIPTMVVTE